jgi:hypothetical protein
MKNIQNQLKRITKTLIDPSDHYPKITEATNDLYQLFLEVSGLETEDRQNRESIFLSHGKAIGTVWAALCIKEILRTKRFIRGLYRGIKSACQRFPGEPIRILYVGTGPFATLAIPLTTVFTSAEISFTFLEINPGSIRFLEKVIDAFQIKEYVHEIKKVDALEYLMDRNNPNHIVITETMQNALQKEPQVGITMNLVPQMEPKAILIPENIVIEAALLDPRKNMDRITGVNDCGRDCYRILGKVFEISKETMASQPSGINSQDVSDFAEVEIEVPAGIPSGYKQLCLFTRIRVFEAEKLDYWQCSLTQPQIIMNLEQSKNMINRIGFQYVIGKSPGFRWRIIA